MFILKFRFLQKIQKKTCYNIIKTYFEHALEESYYEKSKLNQNLKQKKIKTN